ncbi:MAG TPA: cytidylate kinase-like family protein [Prolixibacteraceae bacterium]|nr:cytidylate kinase-like family protein [Prolixibacteraceae bacterium]
MNEKFIISIGRQFGSGGREIGEKLAASLEFSFYDKELIQLASEQSGLGKEFFEKADEKTSFSFLGGLFGAHNNFSNEMYSNSYLSNEALFKLQSDVISDLAQKQSCVFIGRCADYVLKDHPHCLNIFISADMDDRIKRIIRKQNIPENKAADLIEKTDKKRASYYNYYSNKVWGAADSYHLCINSSVLGIDGTVEAIRDFAVKMFKI